MPRTPRSALDGECCHVLNRGNDRRAVFLKSGDYVSFLKAVANLSGNQRMLQSLSLRRPQCPRLPFGGPGAACGPSLTRPARRVASGNTGLRAGCVSDGPTALVYHAEFRVRRMHRLQNTHVRRYHQHYKGSGHIWQGRYKNIAGDVRIRAGDED